MLTDAHKKFIRDIRKKKLIHNNSPIYIDSVSGQQIEVSISDMENIIDRWILPASNMAFVSNNFCIVVNTLNEYEFRYIILLRHRFQHDPKQIIKSYGKVSLTGEVSNPYSYTSTFVGKTKKTMTRTYSSKTYTADVAGGALDVVNSALLALYYYFGMTIIDHEYIDIEDQEEIHYSTSDNKPPVKVRYIRRVLKRYVNDTKTERGPVTTGWDVPDKLRLYKHPRYKNVRGQKLWVRGYHVGPPTDNRPIEYRRKEEL